MGGYDRDTAGSAGLSGTAAPYRLTVRKRLRGRLEDEVRGLFDSQVRSLSRITVKRFEAALLKESRGKGRGKNDNDVDPSGRGAARRAAAYAFDSALKDLEVPSLNLVRSEAVREMEGLLNDSLMTHDESPAKKLADQTEVKKAATKERKPSERSVDVKVDLVAMIRPDGFGNLQGYVGYQAPWGSQVTVGFQNDADSPEVISQFGGVRPPFIRVQPKLKLDIEL